MARKKLRRVYVDVETQADIDLKKVGALTYTAHPSFRCYLIQYAVDDGPVKVIRYPEKGKLPAELKKLVNARNVVFVSHNAQFDRTALRAWTGVDIPLSRWDDTVARAAAYGAGLKLEVAQKNLGFQGKDQEGSRVLSRYYTRKDIPEEALEKIVEYGIRDVEALREIDRVLPPLDDMNRAIYEAIARQSETGIKIDPETVRRMADIDEKLLNALDAEAAAYGTYGNDKLRLDSTDQTKLVLKERFGLVVPSLNEKKLADWLTLNGITLPKEAERIIELYRAKNAKGVMKIRALAAICENERYPLVTAHQIHHGAHTGRPAGRGVNLHNVTRLESIDEDRDRETILNELENLEDPITGRKRLGSMAWAALLPDNPRHVIVRSDLSAIEPRCGAWFRQDRRLLKLYADVDAGKAKDEYTQFGERMGFPKDILRARSKIAILAACYGNGPEGYRSMCRQNGIPDPGEEEAKRVIQAYHLQNPTVKQTWYDLMAVCVMVIKTGRTFHFNGPGGRPSIGLKELNGRKFLIVTLPSGRVKGYADVKVRVNRWGSEAFSYRTYYGYETELYASKLYENFIQMLAADVLFEKALRIEKSLGVRCLHTVYDEAIFSAPRSKAEKIHAIMAEPCPFAPGMPISAKTVVSKTFHKGDRL